MKTISRLLVGCFALISLALASPLRAEAEKRIALVIGNAAYQAGPLATPANDAGLVAQTLQAAGFDVAGARDLDGEALRAAFRDFLDKAQASGPDTVAFVYLSGYGVQLEGENYFVPVDAKIAAAADAPVEALRVSDYTKRLAGLPLKASFIVLDGARASPFAKSGPPLAGGLALVDPAPNMLVAFNAAPGTVAPAESGPYGAYARALVEMIREGGLSPSEVFDGVRLRVNDVTKGAQVPWYASRIEARFVFFERAADAPPPAVAPERLDAMRSRPLRDLGVQNAYAAAIERDTLQGYEEFLAAYPDHPLAKRIRALLAVRREAMTWRRTCDIDTPDAYWSYLRRYPRGPHSADARRRLATLAAAEEPPPSFSPIVYDVPPPPPPEIVYVDRPVLVFSDPAFDFPPPPPIVFLAPPPPALVVLPPPVVFEAFVLPIPLFVPIPIWVAPPPFVAPPVNNFIFNNIHNTVIVNKTTNAVTVKSPSGQVVSSAPITATAAGAPTIAPPLPASVAKKATMIGGNPPGSPANRPGQAVPGAVPGQPGALPSPRLPAGQAVPGAVPGQPGALPSPHLPAGQALPGAAGKPLPGPGGKPVAPAQQRPQPALPGAPQNPPGAPPQNKPPAAHALPSGQQLPPLPRGHVAPGGAEKGRITPPGVLPPPGQQPPRLPAGQLPPPDHLAPSGAKPAVPGPGHKVVPKPQQLQQAPKQYQQTHPPQPAYQPPRAPPPQQQWHPPQQQHPSQPAYQPPHAPPPQPRHPPQPAYQPPRAPPPQQQWHPSQPAYQPPRAPPPQQQWHPPQPAYQPPRAPPPQQQKPACGQPGLPPCH